MPAHTDHVEVTDAELEALLSNTDGGLKCGWLRIATDDEGATVSERECGVRARWVLTWRCDCGGSNVVPSCDGCKEEAESIPDVAATIIAWREL